MIDKQALKTELILLGYDMDTIDNFIYGLDESQLERSISQLIHDFHLIFNVE